MKKLKHFIEFIKESNDEWVERTVPIPVKDFFSKWFSDKKKIDEDDNYITYVYHNKEYDDKEGEYWWEKKKIIKLDKSRDDVTHYYEYDEINRPLYKVREEGMTREQELMIRCWCGTEKNPKPNGKYIGFEKGLAMYKSFLSDRINGKLYHVLPDGDILEMLDDEKLEDEDYVNDKIDFLLDTRNEDKIHIIQRQLGN